MLLRPTVRQLPEAPDLVSCATFRPGAHVDLASICLRQLLLRLAQDCDETLVDPTIPIPLAQSSGYDYHPCLNRAHKHYIAPYHTSLVDLEALSCSKSAILIVHSLGPGAGARALAIESIDTQLKTRASTPSSPS